MSVLPDHIKFNGRNIPAVLWNETMPDIPPNELLVGCDTETVKIVLGSPLIPVTLQCYYPKSNVVHVVFGGYAINLYMDQMRLKCSDSTLVFHNIGFDFAVLGGRTNPWLMWMADRGHLKDLGLRYLLHKAAVGEWSAKQQRWSLDHVVMERLGVYLEKDDDIRLTYHPNMVLTDRHFVYAAIDPVATLEAFTTFPGYAEYGLGKGIYPTEDIQVRGAIALYEIGSKGIRRDEARADQLHAAFTTDMLDNLKILHTFGYYPKAEGQPSAAGGQKVLQKILHNIEERTGLSLPRTEKANTVSATGRVVPDLIKTGKEVIEALPDGKHPFLDALREFEYARKVLTTYFGDAYMGADGRMHASFQPLVKTGRTSCRKPNLQNPHRKGGIRGMFIPDDGKVFYSDDYDQLEMCTLAESCYEWFGESKLMELINDGVDLHTHLGNMIRDAWGGIDDGSINFRQCAKAPNFGKSYKSLQSNMIQDLAA